MENSSIILPCSHKSDFVELLSISEVLFTFLPLLIPDIVEDIVILKISLEYLNEPSVGLSTYSGDVILHRGEAERENKLLLQIIYSHRLEGTTHRSS